MAKQLVKLYVVKHLSGWQNDSIEVSTYNISEMEHYNCVLIGTHEIEIEYEEIDTRLAEIQKLETIIEKERAESQSRVSLLLERISKLQCISFDADGVKL
jgi:hypothetical protein